MRCVTNTHPTTCRIVRKESFSIVPCCDIAQCRSPRHIQGSLDPNITTKQGNSRNTLSALDRHIVGKLGSTRHIQGSLNSNITGKRRRPRHIQCASQIQRPCNPSIPRYVQGVQVGIGRIIDRNKSIVDESSSDQRQQTRLIARRDTPTQDNLSGTNIRPNRASADRQITINEDIARKVSIARNIDMLRGVGQVNSQLAGN